MAASARESFIHDVARTLRHLRRRRLKVHVPQGQELHRNRKGYEFHATPEFFLQTGGGTDFTCPGDRFRLHTDEICVMPRGVPHHETPRDLASPYGILVCMYDRNGMFMHRGRADDARRIEGYGTLHLLGLRGRDAFRYLDDIAASRPVPAAHRAAYISALLETFLLTVLTQLKCRLNPERPVGSPLVVEAEKQVRARLADSNLTVARLAAQVGCTPDHLSRQFHRERSVNLSSWIAAERVALAKDLLVDLRYNVAEVAWACGFKEPSYFIRVFRRHTGATPRLFRTELSKREG